MRIKPVEVQIGEILRGRKLTLATAESCTGGLIGHMLTNVPGSSDYYLGGVIAYANRVKHNQLGVHLESLARFGAVSQEVVLEMSRGARQALRADIGLAVSGIAGPGGGSLKKPVGYTWIGLSDANGELSWNYIWTGSRRENKRLTAVQALHLLLDHLMTK